MRRLALAGLLLANLVIPCAVASGQRLSVRGPDPTPVRIGDQAMLVIVVDGATEPVALGPLPRIEGVEIAATAPRRGSSQSITDGRIVEQTTVTFEIRLSPAQAGEFDIPPISVATGAATLRTEPSRLVAVADELGDAHAFVALTAEPPEVHVHEPFRLKLTIGFDRAFFEASVVQMFRRQLDVPVEIHAPALDAPSGAAVVPGAAEIGNAAATLALNGNIVRAAPRDDVLRDGRPFRILVIERILVPERSGDFRIGAGTMRFAVATGFREDLLGGRVPEGLRPALVAGAPLVVPVRALPEEGRPEGYAGAVGRFSVEAAAEPASVAAGGTVRLRLRVSSEGPVGAIAVPPFPPTEGFHVLGARVEENSDPQERTFVYEVVPLRAGLPELPPVPFAFFDPGPPAAYRVVRTRAIPIDVTPAAGDTGTRGTGESGGDGEERLDIRPPRRSTARHRVSTAFLLAALLLPFVPALLLRAWLRAREQARLHPEIARARRAASVFAQRLLAPDADPAAALVEYLAARLRCPDSAVIGPDLPDRLARAGVPDPLAARAATLLDGLTAARFGGTMPPDAAASGRALVAAIETAFSTGGERP